jgi:hypothetical protein
MTDSRLYTAAEEAHLVERHLGAAATSRPFSRHFAEVQVEYAQAALARLSTLMEALGAEIQRSQAITENKDAA